MRNDFDIAAYSPSGQLFMVAEVKWLKENSDEDAAFFRKNLLASGLLSDSLFFLLAYRNGLYLWKGNSDASAHADFKSPAKPVLRKYLGSLAESERGPGPEGMESAIALWLSDLASGAEKPDPSSPADKMLLDSGLMNCLKGGRIRREFGK